MGSCSCRLLQCCWSSDTGRHDPILPASPGLVAGPDVTTVRWWVHGAGCWDRGQVTGVNLRRPAVLVRAVRQAYPNCTFDYHAFTGTEWVELDVIAGEVEELEEEDEDDLQIRPLVGALFVSVRLDTRVAPRDSRLYRLGERFRIEQFQENVRKLRARAKREISLHKHTPKPELQDILAPSQSFKAQSLTPWSDLGKPLLDASTSSQRSHLSASAVRSSSFSIPASAPGDRSARTKLEQNRHLAKQNLSQADDVRRKSAGLEREAQGLELSAQRLLAKSKKEAKETEKAGKCRAQ
eukprot:gb/GEZN01013130.1/.p1 GENE.gb/GEZN01013130.1/~~gb/GEZN01013130.1/.p1  ORF type:complete len:295 (-),score=25.66 gb/GEZN01013130.1/:70-954(-)